jgi:hypothetical protein
MYFCVVLCIDCFVTFSVLFVCMCVLNYCHRVATQLQLNISYHISHHITSYIIPYHTISYHFISYHISYHTISSPKIISGTPYLTEFCADVRFCNVNTASCTIQGDEGKKSQRSQDFHGSCTIKCFTMESNSLILSDYCRFKHYFVR